MPKYLEDMPEKGVLEDTDLLPGKDMTEGKASKITMLGIAEYIIKKITALPGAVKSHLENKNNPHGVTKAQIGLENVENKSSAMIRSEITADNVTKSLGYTPLDASKKGAANGVAELDTAGKVPSSQLPSFVDDVLEGYLSGGKFYEESTHASLINGETGKIYIDLSSGKTYRWSGSTYAEISQSLALGETSSTAYRGDKGKTAYDHAQKISGNPHGVTKGDVGLENVPNVTTNDQTPTFTVADNDTALQSGEKLSVSLGKIAKAILSMISLKKEVAELDSNINKLIPDYSQRVEIINGNVHDYPSLGDGWIQIRGRNGATSVDGALMRLFINGVLIDETSVSGRYKYYTSALYPIKEGDIIKVTDASYSETNQILFYPGRGI